MALPPAFSTPHDLAVVAINHRSEKSIAQELPNELITSIASYLVLLPSYYDHTYNLNNLFSAAEVCHRWREAMFNDPRLWTDVGFIPASHRSLQRASHILDKVVSLSKDLPLNITVALWGTQLEEEVFLTQILDVSARCASLTLSLPNELYIKFIGQTRSFPMLRRLSLTPFSDPGDTTRYGKAMDAMRLWPYLPALKDLEIVCSTTDCLRSVPGYLTNLSIRLNGDAGRLFFPFIAMLGSYKTLTSVTFHATFCKTEAEHGSANPTSACSTSITTLCLKDYAVHLLDYITLPSLGSLSVNTLGWETPDVHAEIVADSMPSIVRFLDRSNPPLENLTLWKSELTPTMLSSVLSYLPRLKAFDLRVDLFGNLEFLTTFFDKLSRSDCNGAFEVLPCLSRLLIDLDCDFAEKGYDVAKSVDAVDGKHFVNMIRARAAQVNSTLRYVRIVADGNGYCNLAESDIDAMDECGRLVGLKVVIDDAERRRR